MLLLSELAMFEAVVKMLRDDYAAETAYELYYRSLIMSRMPKASECCKDPHFPFSLMF